MRISLITALMVPFLISACSRPGEQNSKPSADSLSGTIEEIIVPETFPYQSEKFDWASLEKNVADEIKHGFVDSMIWYKNFYSETDYFKYVHVLDLNANGVDDYIYSGPGPVDEFTVMKIDSLFFSDGSEIVNLKMDKGVLSKLYTRSTLSTAAPPISGQDIFEINFDRGKVNLHKIFRGMVVDSNMKPSLWFDPYKVLWIESDTTILRSDPEIVDSPESELYENLNGNHLGIILKGAIIYLVGELTDTVGDKWYFVLIPPGSEIIGYPLYENNKFDSAGTLYYTGWIKAL